MCLIRDAIFRPQLKSSSSQVSGHFSLGIRPLAELADMYHGRKATDPRDKVFALLGMSTDDPNMTGILADYEAFLDPAMCKLVQSSLSARALATHLQNKEAMVVKVKGCVLGKIIPPLSMKLRTDNTSNVLSNNDAAAAAVAQRGDRQIIDITWTNPLLSPRLLRRPTLAGWTFHITAQLVQEGDIICLVEGAKHLSIIRVHQDYSSIIATSVPGLDKEQLPWSPTMATDAFPTQFLLVWDWGNSPSNSDLARGFQYYQPFSSSSSSALGTAATTPETTKIKAHLEEAVRLFDVAEILRIAARHEEETRRIFAAGQICSRALKD